MSKEKWKYLLILLSLLLLPTAMFTFYFLFKEKTALHISWNRNNILALIASAILDIIKLYILLT